MLAAGALPHRSGYGERIGRTTVALGIDDRRRGTVPAMPSLHAIVTFAGAAIVLLVVPGPAVMYIVARSASQGRAAGLVSVAGIHVGTIVHIVAAVAGLSALLATSAAAFAAVKLAGAVYLVWLGIRSLWAHWHGHGASRPVGDAQRSLRRVFVDGIVLNVLNPKTAVFFLAFVPQFIDPKAASAAGQVAVLGAVFIALGLLSDGVYAAMGGWLGRPSTRAGLRTRRTDLVAGSVYIGLGAATAVSGASAS